MAHKKQKQTQVISVGSAPPLSSGAQRPIVLLCKEQSSASRRQLDIEVQVRPQELPYRSESFIVIFIQFMVNAHFPGEKVTESKPKRNLEQVSLNLQRSSSTTGALGFELGPKVAERVTEITAALRVSRERQRQLQSSFGMPFVSVIAEQGSSTEMASWFIRFAAPDDWAEAKEHSKKKIRKIVDDYRGSLSMSATAERKLPKTSTVVWAEVSPAHLFVLRRSRKIPIGRFFQSIGLTKRARNHFKGLVSETGSRFVECSLGEGDHHG